MSGFIVLACFYCWLFACWLMVESPFNPYRFCLAILMACIASGSCCAAVDVWQNQ